MRDGHETSDSLQPRGDRRPRVLHDVALQFGVSIAAWLFALLISLIAARRDDVDWWWPAALGLLAVCLTLVAGRRAIGRRRAVLRVLQEVSSSRCGDRFLELAGQCFLRLTPDRAMAVLEGVAANRRYPNRRFLEDLAQLGSIASRGEGDWQDLALEYVRRVADAKTLVRAQVVEHLSEYIGRLPEGSQIVLYGYSKTVCDAVAECSRRLRGSVFLIEDLQYGVEGSLGEHVHAAEHLRRARIEPILLGFDEITQLCSPTVDFVHSSTGRSVPLPRRRRVIALLGCEAVSMDGTILMPSAIRGRPSETAKFVEIFQLAAEGEDHAGEIVVAFEGYKLYEELPEGATRSHAPLKPAGAADLAYIGFGFPRPDRRVMNVDLVRLEPEQVNVLVDDVGIHRAAEADLLVSRERWQKRALPRPEEDVNASRLGSRLAKARCVIFDMNGVLIDDESMHYAAFADAVRALGGRLTHDDYVRLCSGRTDREGVENLIEVKQLATTPDDLLSSKREAYSRHSTSDSLLFPGTLDVLAGLRSRGVELYLLTSSEAPSIDEFLTGLGIAEFFAPERRLFERSARERFNDYRDIVRDCGGRSGGCVVVDDTPANLREARRLGMYTVGVATTHPASRLEADVVVQSVAALNDALAP